MMNNVNPMQNQGLNTNPNQLQYNNINPKAFDINTTSQLFSNSNMDPLTGQYIDPTLSQGTNPGTVNPMEVQNLQASTQY